MRGTCLYTAPRLFSLLLKAPTHPLSLLQALTAKGVQAYNTRLFKRDKNGKTSLDVLVASARTDIPPTILEEGSAASPQVSKKTRERQVKKRDKRGKLGM